MRIGLGLAIATAALSLAIAASAQIDATQFKVGSATMADVVAKLGRPMTVIQSSTGDQTAVYSTSKLHIKGATFIPIVGLFAGGTKTATSTASFVFGADGLLKSNTSSDMNLDCSSSIVGAGCKPQ